MAADEADDEPESGRAEATDELWAALRIDPIEIALPGGVGYTLRAYRPVGGAVADTSDQDGPTDLDDYDAAAAAVLRRRRADAPETEPEDESMGLDALDPDLETEDEEPAEKEDSDDEDSDDEDSDDEDSDDEDPDDELDDELEDEDDTEDDEDEEEQEPEEEAVAEDVPIFLGRRGKLYLFHNPEKLVEFVRSDVEHDLSQLDTWADLVERLTPDDVVPVPEDTYELDLVVENLRGGPDAWDAPLILRAGELARDLGYALRMPAILAAMATESPLDDLDEALRATDKGGVSGFLARRRLRKIPGQQSALAWRTMIGKISAAADWRD